jgi:hypothetical protein
VSSEEAYRAIAPEGSLGYDMVYPQVPSEIAPLVSVSDFSHERNVGSRDRE